MTSRPLLAALAALPLGIVFACSSSDTSSPAPAESDAATADEPFVPNPNNCVKPGTAGNDKGIGAYCDPDTRCGKSPDPNVFLICTSTDKSTPTDSYFCTAPCTLDEDCGKNAYCGKSSAGSGCVPFACGTPPADSGAPGDAGEVADANDQ